jgi:hypothetical protein
MAAHMPEQAANDKALRCSSCGDTFVFTSGEQELFRLRGVMVEPAHCPNCTRGGFVSAPAERGGSARSRH